MGNHAISDREKIRAWHHTPCTTDIQNPYRSELPCLLGVIHIINKICELNQILTGHVTTACNGLGALDNISDLTLNIMSQKKYYDLLYSIYNHLKSSPIQ